MKIDASGYFSSIDGAGRAAAAAERTGHDGWWATETQVDPFLACAVAAERTERVEIGTGIAVALARNPMTVAVQANDLQSLSGGAVHARPRRVRDHRAVDDRHGGLGGGAGGRGAGGQGADRLLRIDPRLSRGARGPRMERPARGAERDGGPR